MPWNWQESTILYIFSIGYEAMSNLFVGIIFPNADLFFMSIAILTAYQFDILGENYKNCVPTTLSKCGFTQLEIETFKRSLEDPTFQNAVTKRIETFIDTDHFKSKIEEVFLGYVKRHQQLLASCVEFEEFFAPIMLPCIGIMVLYSIFMCYCIVVADGENVGFFIQYLISSVSQLFMFSFAGQTLTSSTEDMRIKLYDIPWYLLDENVKYALLSTLMRLLRPVNLSAGYFIIISYNSFLSVSIIHTKTDGPENDSLSSVF